MSDSTRLGLPYLAAGQAQKHVTVNESLARLDALVQLSVISSAVGAQPGSPTDADIYILPSGKTGAAWGAMSIGALAYYHDGAWEEIAPDEGWRAYVCDSDELLVYGGGAWTSPSLRNTPHIGVNAAADATNRLALASAASLFSHDGAGHQLKINKASSGDTASVVLQTGFSGRAEMGLTGDDNLHIKVSADGSAWTSAITIDRSSGRVGLGTNAPTAPLALNANAAALATPPSGTVAHISGADATNARLVIDAFGAQPLINFRRADGTGASPSALQSGDGMGGFNWFGYAASGFTSGSLVELSALAAENWSGSAQGCALRAFTTPNGATTKAERLRIDQDGALTVRANAQVLVDANGLVGLRSYTAATLPSASTAARLIYVSDESGGAVVAFSDGTNWRRVTDRAVVS